MENNYSENNLDLNSEATAGTLGIHKMDSTHFKTLQERAEMLWLAILLVRGEVLIVNFSLESVCRYRCVYVCK